jgi:hypothetical protein
MEVPSLHLLEGLKKKHIKNLLITEDVPVEVRNICLIDNWPQLSASVRAHAQVKVHISNIYINLHLPRLYLYWIYGK